MFAHIRKALIRNGAYLVGHSRAFDVLCFDAPNGARDKQLVLAYSSPQTIALLRDVVMWVQNRSSSDSIEPARFFANAALCRAGGTDVESFKLAGHSILIVEDEIMILMDMQNTLEEAGARVFASTNLGHALLLADTPGLSAAVIDFSLGADDGGAVCRQLTKRSVPFVFYSGVDRRAASSWSNVPFVSKPAQPQTVVDTVVSVLSNGLTGKGFRSADEARHI